MGLLDRAETWLPAKTRKARPRSVVLTRGATSVTIAGATGRSEFEQQNNRGEMVQWSSRDYFLPVSEIGVLFPPQAGDTIAETINGTACTFEVLPIASGPAYAWWGDLRTHVRVHTKQTS